MMYKLFPSGDYTSNDSRTQNKPLRYTEEQLEKLVEENKEIKVYDAHNKRNYLGTIQLAYHEGSLYFENPDNIQINGYGLSPSFHGNIIDKGEYYIYDKISLDHLARTKKPRTGIIYNLTTNNSEGDGKMNIDAEKLIQKKDNQITSLQEDNAILKKQLEEATKEAKRVKKLEKQLEDTKQELQDLTTANEEYKSDAEAYRTYRQEKKDNIIKELFEDDNECYEQFKDLSLEQLETLQTKQVLDQTPKPSIKANGGGTTGQDEGNPTPQVEEKELEDLSYEERKQKFAKYGF